MVHTNPFVSGKLTRIETGYPNRGFHHLASRFPRRDCAFGFEIWGNPQSPMKQLCGGNIK